MSQGFSRSQIDKALHSDKHKKEISDDEYHRIAAADIQAAQRRLSELPTNDRRGLEDETFYHFGIGFLSDWKHPKNPYSNPTPRFIIPLGDRRNDPPAYNAVMTTSGRERFKNSDRREAQKCLTAIKKLVFHPSALEVGIVAVTEGELDSVSLWQSFHGKLVCDELVDVCALGGTGGASADLVERLKAMEQKPRLVILLFDGDDNHGDNRKPGRERAEELKKELWKIGVVAVCEFFEDVLTDEEKKEIGDKPDANEILQRKGNDYLYYIFSRVVKKAIEDAKQASEEMKRWQEYMREQSANNAGDTLTLSTRNNQSNENQNFNDRPEIKELIDEINATITSAMLEEKGYIRHSAKGNPRPNGYECNFCGSGTHKEKTGGLGFTDTAPIIFNCLACGKSGSVFQFLRIVKGKEHARGKEFFDTLKEIADEFGISYEPKIFEPVPSKLRRVAELKKLPQSVKRDKDIIAAVRDACEWRAIKDKDENGQTVTKRLSIKPTQDNLDLIFKHDPNLCGLVGHDQFQGVSVFLKRAPWHDADRTGEQWHDTDGAELRVYLRKTYADLEHKQRIEDSLIHFAHRNAFNAVKQFLSSLPKWDGEARAETLFVKFLHAEDSEYTRVVTLNFLLGALARVYHPGVEFANCLVVQGAQRIGKSRLIRMLGGKEGVNLSGQNWHVALKDSVDDSHATDALMKGWIIEIEEFSAARKAEINALKNFISATEDTRRFSYDRYASTRLRNNVFAVTCNDQGFLRDQTGNARFIIVKCSQKKFDRVPGMTPEYIRQVWAEVLHIYNEQFKNLSKEAIGAKLLLPLKIQMQAESIAETFTQDDGMKLEIQSYLDRKIPPQVIWTLLTREKRRKFIAEGQITVYQSELNFARRARGGQKSIVQKNIDEIDRILRSGNGVLKETISIKGEPPQERFILFGSEYRQHICTAEIFNECFGQDKRKSMHRISEIISMMDGWTLGKRLRKIDPEYDDQTKPYYRDEDNQPNDDDENDETKHYQEISGDPVSLDDLPIDI